MKERDKGPSRWHRQLHSVRQPRILPCTATRWSGLRHTTSLSASAAPRRHFGLPARSAAACTVTLMLILGLDGGGTSTKAVLADVQTEAVTVVGMGSPVARTSTRWAWKRLNVRCVRRSNRRSGRFPLGSSPPGLSPSLAAQPFGRRPLCGTRWCQGHRLGLVMTYRPPSPLGPRRGSAWSPSPGLAR